MQAGLICGSIVPWQPETIHAAEIAWIDGFAFAIDHKTPRLGEGDCCPADRRQQFVPVAVRCDGGGDFRRAEGLGPRLGQYIQNSFVEGFGVDRIRIGFIHANAMTYSRRRGNNRGYFAGYLAGYFAMAR